MFKYEKEGIFCLGVTKVESLDGKIIDKHFLVFDYTVKQVFPIDGYRKEILKELSRVINITSS